MARDSVTLPFADGEHELRGKHVFRTARAIEPIITVTEIAIYSQRGALPYAAIADAYAVALKKAGATGDPEAVFDWLYEGEGEGQNIFRAMEKLAEILVPASARQALDQAGQAGPDADPTQAGQPS
jgi:hypothetical protein